MRDLTVQEIGYVAGGNGTCSASDSGGGNTIGGISSSGDVGQDLINIYEGIVAAVSHVIERVANSF